MVQGEKLVLLLGATGSGKSSFINSIVNEEIATGPDKRSSATAVHEYAWTSQSGDDVVLIDTPGLHELEGSTGAGALTFNISGQITSFLKATYDAGKKFSGVIYVHDIRTFPDETMARNISLLKKLCGTTVMKNVTMVTTFWDLLSSRSVGFDVERELQGEGDLFKEFKDNGTEFSRSGQWSEDAEDSLDEDIFPYPDEVVERLLTLESFCLKMQEGIADAKTSSGGASSPKIDACGVLESALVVPLDVEVSDGDNLSHHDEIGLGIRGCRMKEIERKTGVEILNEPSPKTKLGALKHKSCGALDDLMEDLQMMEFDLARRRQAIDSRIARMHVSATQLATERDELVKENNRLRETNRQLQLAYSTLSTTHTSRDSEAENLQLKEELGATHLRDVNAQTLKKELERVTMDRDALRKVNAQLEDDIRQARAVATASIQADFEKTQQLARKLDQTQSALVATTSQLEWLQGEHKKQAAELSVRHVDDINQLRDELVKLKMSVAELTPTAKSPGSDKAGGSPQPSQTPSRRPRNTSFKPPTRPAVHMNAGPGFPLYPAAEKRQGEDSEESDEPSGRPVRLTTEQRESSYVGSSLPAPTAQVNTGERSHSRSMYSRWARQSEGGMRN